MILASQLTLGLQAVDPAEVTAWAMDLEAPTPWVVDHMVSDPWVMESMASLSWATNPDSAAQPTWLLGTAKLLVAN